MELNLTFYKFHLYIVYFYFNKLLPVSLRYNFVKSHIYRNHIVMRLVKSC